MCGVGHVRRWTGRGAKTRRSPGSRPGERPPLGASRWTIPAEVVALVLPSGRPSCSPVGASSGGGTPFAGPVDAPARAGPLVGPLAGRTVARAAPTVAASRRAANRPPAAGLPLLPRRLADPKAAHSMLPHRPPASRRSQGCWHRHDPSADSAGASGRLPGLSSGSPTVVLRTARASWLNSNLHDAKPQVKSLFRKTQGSPQDFFAVPRSPIVVHIPGRSVHMIDVRHPHGGHHSSTWRPHVRR